MRAYSNNGLASRPVDDDYVAQAGEILLDHYPPEPGEIPSYDAALAAEVKAQTRAETITKIQALESTQPRAIREAVLTGDKTRLQAIEDQIAELRTKLV